MRKSIYLIFGLFMGMLTLTWAFEPHYGTGVMLPPVSAVAPMSQGSDALLPSTSTIASAPQGGEAMLPPTSAVAPAPKGKQDDQIHLLHADRLYYNVRVRSDAQILVGNVAFEHQGTTMYCDSALYFQQTKSFDAFGNVKMKQGDTLTLTGQTLYYDGIEQKARMSGHEVLLKHRDTKLYTDSLVYDKLFGVGYFPDKGRLIDQGNQLTSDYGSYTPSTRQAVFNFNVRLINPLPPEPVKSELLSDTLYYNTGSGVAHVVGPSNITQGTTLIYTEDGNYDSKNDFSYLLNRSHVNYVSKRIEGDSLNYDGKTKVSKGFGQVVYDDFANKNRFLGNYLLYNDSTGYAEAADSALCVDYSQRDTLWAHGDSLKMYTYFLDTDSMYRVIHAYHKVRMFRADMQAVCDSLVYTGLDSCITMYRDPILWQMGQQIVGEKIMAWTNDSTLDSIHVINQALLVERMDSVHYNQVASKEMYSYFKDGEVYLNKAEGNVLVNYYPLDDDSLMVGMIHAESSELKLFVDRRKVQRIWMPSTNGMFYPIEKTPDKDRYLPNFVWFDYVRPKDKDDVFVWRPKKAGSELKESVLHQAPTQKLDDLKKAKLKKNPAENKEKQGDEAEKTLTESETQSVVAKKQEGASGAQQETAGEGN